MFSSRFILQSGQRKKYCKIVCFDERAFMVPDLMGAVLLSSAVPWGLHDVGHCGEGGR
jgi:hypothetical protein